MTLPKTDVWPDKSAAKTETVPQVTAELFVIPHDGEYLVYAPSKRSAFLASVKVVNIIAEIQDGTANFEDSQVRMLIEFLRRLGIVDGQPETPPITTFTGPPKPTTVTLFLTTACNLRCTYCYAAAGDSPKRTMALETAKKGIDFVIANAQEIGSLDIEVIYHGGGEPTLNWSVLTCSYEYAQQRAMDNGLQLRAGMATNGYLSPERVDWSIKHLNSINVSMDGAPAVHDSHRMTVMGNGSSQRVMETLRRFDEVDFRYTVRLTVTHDQIDKLPESISYICENCRPTKIHVEPAFAIGRWKDAPSMETMSFLNNYRLAQTLARKHGRELYFSAADLSKSSNHFCGVTQDGFGLTADGSVSACYEVFLEELPLAEKFIYGRFDRAQQTYQFELPVLNNLREQTVDKRDYCQGCFAKWSCSGDCYHKSINMNGDRKFAGSDRCHVVRELTKDQILHNIAASGGLYWHEPNDEALHGWQK